MGRYKGLNIAMETTYEKGIFHCLKIPHSNAMVWHLFYADQALFVVELDKINIKNLAWILRFIYVLSSLKVNF